MCIVKLWYKFLLIFLTFLAGKDRQIHYLVKNVIIIL